jgi:hypothetical protein
LSVECAAQSEGRSGGIPKVATIKDYPATGLMTGCGNLYFYPAIKTTSSPEAYVFAAHGDGSNAWMNLNGRDVRLRQIRSPNQQSRQFYYRFGKLRINVTFEDFKPENAEVTESDPMFKMKITLTRGRTKRVVRAIGDADC